jgi:hypothetical protein
MVLVAEVEPPSRPADPLGEGGAIERDPPVREDSRLPRSTTGG